VTVTAAALGLMLAGYAGGAIGALASPSHRTARLLAAVGAVIGSLAGLVLAAGVLASQTPMEAGVPGLLTIAGGLALRLDVLGAFFLGIVSIVGLPAAVYGASYTVTYETRYSLRFLGAMLNVFLLGMSIVPAAANILTFVLGWEVMSVASYFLVMTESDETDTREAGLWYAGMTHFGLLLLLPMFFLMIPANGGSAFRDLAAGAAGLSPAARSVVFLLATIAFGSKAGLVPLHVWLPRAHPAAPSHVSALMSGVMIKLGIYGLLRVTLDLLGGGPGWWGALLLALGSASALLGVLYALTERDLKRLLAYSSVENAGIITIGVGAGLLLHSYGLNAVATVALAGALFHCLNHACFKGLLFLAAGSVLHQAHTRDMEQMGGLIKGMPQTALLFALGSAAIAALPPLNGFASEWMIFQGLLAGAQIPRPEVAVGIPVAIGMLALTSGLAAACFVKAFGISFLALPRSDRAAAAVEAAWPMRAAMWILGSACVLLGIAASAVVPGLYRVVGSIGSLAIEGTRRVSPDWWIAAPQGLGVISPALIAAMLVTVIVGALIVTGSAIRRARLADTWGCGRIVQTARMEYTAAAFAQPLLRVFTEFYRPTKDLTVSTHPESRYFVRSITYASEVKPWFEMVIFDPVFRGVRLVSTRVRRLQAGSAHLYLLYLVIALLAALASVWWF
jgi:hydrogenase-4 component B